MKHRQCYIKEVKENEQQQEQGIPKTNQIKIINKWWWWWVEATVNNGHFYHETPHNTTGKITQKNR